jgi:hypothetical protein
LWIRPIQHQKPKLIKGYHLLIFIQIFTHASRQIESRDKYLIANGIRSLDIGHHKNLLSGHGFDFPAMNKNIQGRSMKGIVAVLDYRL